MQYPQVNLLTLQPQQVNQQPVSHPTTVQGLPQNQPLSQPPLQRQAQVQRRPVQGLPQNQPLSQPPLQRQAQVQRQPVQGLPQNQPQNQPMPPRRLHKPLSRPSQVWILRQHSTPNLMSRVHTKRL